MPMDMKNFFAALRPNPHGESHVSEEHRAPTDCGGDGARKHRTRRGTSRLLDTRHGTRMIKLCKRDAEPQHDVCGVVGRWFRECAQRVSAFRS